MRAVRIMILIGCLMPALPAAGATQDTDVKTRFRVKYVAEGAVYLEGGRDAGLAEGQKLTITRFEPAGTAGHPIAGVWLILLLSGQSGAQAPVTVPSLPVLLERVGKSVGVFRKQAPAVTCAEKIVQLKLDGKGKVVQRQEAVPFGLFKENREDLEECFRREKLPWRPGSGPCACRAGSRIRASTCRPPGC